MERKIFAEMTGRLIWMSTLVRLKIHAHNACEQHPVTGVPARSIFIQMALHFHDVTEMTFFASTLCPWDTRVDPVRALTTS